MFQNVILGWFARRGLELGGLAIALTTFITTLPPAYQDALWKLASGHWQDVQLGVLAGLAVSVWGYMWSWRSTVRSQVVTSDKQQIPLSNSRAAQIAVEEIAKAAPKPPTLWEFLTKR